ncbi:MULTISPECIES: hypothetical protein [Bacillus cereus group]|uniref:Uncharacterized protein n=1 Tax=Bacillus cereus (strain VD146) TaxID=1053236 RepID=R8NET0_BACCX|nr:MULTISPECIES: hypothetical protein [Bacillus cereus group]EJP85725.1 hypothetical protein IC3_04628 [Bacillus cereus VD142]EOP44812.1 hypothetical protein IK1_04545 [Bacillus cereus VD146]
MDREEYRKPLYNTEFGKETHITNLNRGSADIYKNKPNTLDED